MLKFYFATIFQSSQRLYEKRDGSGFGAGTGSIPLTNGSRSQTVPGTTFRVRLLMGFKFLGNNWVKSILLIKYRNSRLVLPKLNGFSQGIFHIGLTQGFFSLGLHKVFSKERANANQYKLFLVPGSPQKFRIYDSFRRTFNLSSHISTNLTTTGRFQNFDEQLESLL